MPAPPSGVLFRDIQGGQILGTRPLEHVLADFLTKLSTEEKARRLRKAVASHYRRAAKNEVKQQAKELRGSSKTAVHREIESEDEDEHHVNVSNANIDTAPSGVHRDGTPTFSLEALSPNGCAAFNPYNGIEDDEEVASQVLTSMLLARHQQLQDESTTTTSDTSKAPTSPRVSPPGSPLPPSSPPPASSPQEHRVRKTKGWASPGEWDDPGSPLPTSAYERMPWPRLFKRFWGARGDAELDAD
ncbi:hypothetical protein B0H15DRAFT_796073 [Mycena belliarum]|uniref:Uncharacterized protein n=1 Tax=Mycena belliarum TaxID=1033014 RepID=A0AAD6XT08_9AGAR|nr:hypothetical protein B0H15DRAFT_796073 [Mycena belliae]